MNSQFIQVHHRMVRLDAIAYIDFLESGRSMIFVSGVSQEKQHISVDEFETPRLRAFMESQLAATPAGTAAASGKPPVANAEEDEEYRPKRFSFARA